ncbi:TIGR02281 family clan AA aspartic protease [Agrobacterium vitis]|uniref:retropepsin-like aspartic protease family protein n=1 Tax=Allorhizobium ampelinum TaxID=3025782 RepID=UPI001F2FF627|nr:TIGR02281 family clan AA aspartic protease [Allorhizobium ampelinum]MCF1474583.1 TIGR02281 family clan AA aspartic protease [Allorhizobium ampelinum]
MKLGGFGIVIGILLAGTAVLIINRDSGQSFGMDNDDFARVVTLLPFALMLSAGIVASRHNLGQNLRFAAAWVLIALILVTGYIYRNDAASVADRVLAGLVPGRAVVTTTGDGQSQLVLQRGSSGHFSATVSINGVDIPMMIDTGASAVVLRAEDAASIGINVDDLTYSVTVSTANGEALASPLRLRQVAIGPVIRENVRALITQPGRMDGSLLGMSFLSTLDSIQIRGDELRLTD